MTKDFEEGEHGDRRQELVFVIIDMKRTNAKRAGRFNMKKVCSPSFTLQDFDGEHGDRRQELVLIGIDVKREALEAALDACLATDAEMVGERICVLQIANCKFCKFCKLQIAKYYCICTIILYYALQAPDLPHDT